MANGDSYGFFFNSDSGDRKYNAESFEKWLKKFFTTGVFQGEMQVVADNGLNVKVDSGYANVDGKVRFFGTETLLTLDSPSSTYPRIDTIVVERDDLERQIIIKKVRGAYSGNSPQPTAPVRHGNIFQIVLAQIYVDKGISQITQANITDTRMRKDICGYVTGTVEEIDFSQMQAQFDAYISNFETTQKAEFENWFNQMKDQLSTDAAGNLQNQINDINNNIPTKTSQLTNDSGFIGASSSLGLQLPYETYIKPSNDPAVAFMHFTNVIDGRINTKLNNLSIPTKTSQLTNDSGFITKSVIDNKNFVTTTDIDLRFRTSSEMFSIANTATRFGYIYKMDKIRWIIIDLVPFNTNGTSTINEIKLATLGNNNRPYPGQIRFFPCIIKSDYTILPYPLIITSDGDMYVDKNAVKQTNVIHLNACYIAK